MKIKKPRGEIKSIGEIASQIGVTNTAVGNMINRAFLAPDIIRGIMKGTQPLHLTGDFLKNHTPLHMCREEQRTLLGFK